jgi:DnaJ-class molecular chaperone
MTDDRSEYEQVLDVRCSACRGTGWTADRTTPDDSMICETCGGRGRRHEADEAWVHTDAIGDR